MVTKELDFNAPIAVVYSVISNFAEYPIFVPGVKATKVKKQKDSLIVEFTVNVVKEISYSIKVSLKENEGLSWEFIEGELMKKNSGSWELKPTSPASTHAKYSVDVGFGWLVPSSIVDNLTKIQLPEMLAAFQKQAEKLAAAS